MSSELVSVIDTVVEVAVVLDGLTFIICALLSMIAVTVKIMKWAKK